MVNRFTSAARYQEKYSETLSEMPSRHQEPLLDATSGTREHLLTETDEPDVRRHTVSPSSQV